MKLHDPIHVLLLVAFLAGFVAGVVFAGVIVWLETRKSRSRNHPFVGFDFGSGDSGCTVFGHYTADGVMHIDRVEMDGGCGG